MKTILSIDPGIKHYGYAVIEYDEQELYNNDYELKLLVAGDIENLSSYRGVYENIRDLIISYKL